MKKWNEKKVEPITWGDYANYCKWYMIIVFGIYAIAWIGCVVWYYYEDITTKIRNFADKVKSKFKKN